MGVNSHYPPSLPLVKISMPRPSRSLKNQVIFRVYFICIPIFRWLLAKGRVEEARNVIKYGTKLTGVKISDEVLIDSTSPSRTKHIEAESENLGRKIRKNICTKCEYLFSAEG